MNMQLQLIDIASREVFCLPADATIGEAVRIMAQRRFSSIVVTDAAGHPVGIVTERNVLNAMHAGLPSETSLRTAMSAPVVVMRGTTQCLDGYQTCMREGIRHLVLVDDEGTVAGVVSETDFRLHLNLTVLAGRRQVISVAQRSITSLPPHGSLMQALNMMRAQRETCVVVVEDEKPVGIVTERDVVRFYSREPGRVSVPIAEVMTSPVLTITSHATINQAAELMLEKKLRHLAVVDGVGRMIGLVSEHDLTQTMAQGLQEEKIEMDEIFLRTFIDTIPDMVWLKDVEGKFLSSNRHFEFMLGLKEKEIIGKTDYDFVSKQEADFFREQDRKAMEAAEPRINEEWVTFPATGHRRLFETIKTPMRDGQGRVIGVLGVARDITLRTQQQRQLAMLEYAINHVHEAAYLIDEERRLVYVNDEVCRALGYSREELLNMTLFDIDPDYTLEKGRAIREEVAAKGHCTFETRHRRRNGGLILVEVTVATIAFDGQTLGMSLARDISERKRTEESLRITASVFDNSQEAIIITDANNNIINANPAFERITGYSRDEVLGRNPKLLNSGRQDRLFYAEMWRALRENKVWRGEVWNRRKCGDIYAELLSISAICDEAGKVQSYVGVFSDITYFKDHEAELSHVANFDALTGIPNRRLLADRLRQAIAHAQRHEKILAVCYIDLDGFKEVNDNYGHEAGDRLLVGVTQRLKQELRAGDTLARLGGDEFVLLFNDLSQEIECFQVLERVMQSIADPIQIDGHKVAVSASIGVTFYPEDNEDGDMLLRHADQAMYVAKQAGKNRFHLFDPVHDQRMRSLHDSRRRIQQGLERGEFELYYQPKLELASGKIVGVEALIRWHHPEQGLLYPIEFLPIIENSDLEIGLGNWVMDRALAQLHAWARAGVEMEVSINISARHLQSPDFTGELRRKLGQYPKLQRGRLQIEVLETAALEDMAQSAELIETCRELGVSFALDDFGTGYSSLMYLSKLTADTLKIDQSFVQGMVSNEGDRAIVQGVIALAGTFGRKTVAEGIEDHRLLGMLVEMGCGYGQGYSIAQPMPAGEFLDWYRKY